MKNRPARIHMVEVMAIQLLALAIAPERVLGQESGTGGEPPGPIYEEVVLREGKVYRGTIAEAVPNEHVVLVTLSGKILRFPMNEVSYYGPVRKPAATTTAVAFTPDRQDPEHVVSQLGKKNRLRLESPEENVDFHMLAATAKGSFDSGYGSGTAKVRSYKHICTAPCEIELPTGKYKLALSKGDGLPIETKEPVDISRPSVLTGKLISRQDIRTMGWVLMGVGSALGLGMMAGSIDDSEDGLDDGLMIGGATIAVSSVLISLFLTMVDDEAEISVSPMTF